jgi:predicted aminopeptidase
MGRMKPRRRSTLSLAALALAAALAMLAGGCAQVGYYAQAAQGQYSLWSEARPIADWLGDPATMVFSHRRLRQLPRLLQQGGGRAVRQCAARRFV